MPFVNNDYTECHYWWGDIEITKKYCIEVINHVVKEYGADSDRVILMGFSRGGIACNYVGLHDDNIASIWRAMFIYSHYDGLRIDWKYPDADRESAYMRFKRLNKRPQLIAQERSVESIKSYVEPWSFQGQFTFITVPFQNHSTR